LNPASLWPGLDPSEGEEVELVLPPVQRCREEEPEATPVLPPLLSYREAESKAGFTTPPPRSRREAELEAQLLASQRHVENLQRRLEARKAVILEQQLQELHAQQQQQRSFFSWPFACFSLQCGAQQPSGEPLGRPPGSAAPLPRHHSAGLEPDPFEVPFMPPTPAKALDVVVECVHALGTDLDSLPRWQRRLAKRIAVEGSWPIGPSQQPETFQRLLCCNAGDAAASGLALPESGCFFELSWEPPCLYLRKPAPDLPLLVDGAPVEQPAHALLGDAVIGLGLGGGGKPRIAFRILRDPAMQEAAIDAWLFHPTPESCSAKHSRQRQRSRALTPEPQGEVVYHL